MAIRMLVVLAFGCIAAGGSGQATDAPTAHTLAGQVVDSVTGQPIARALVRAGNRDGLTDHEGRFSFDNQPEGQAIALKPGYLVEPGAVAGSEPLLLRLIPEAILYGTVTDADSQPLQNLQIQLRRLEVRAGVAHWQQTQDTMANAEGEFRFAELPAGKYSLATALMMDGLPDAASSQAYVPTLYPPPGPGEGEGEHAVTLRAGDHVRANLNLAAEKLYPVSGVLHGSSGRGVSFLVETLEGLIVNTDLHFSRDNGAFRFRVPRGSYRLLAQPQEDNQQSFGSAEITVGPAGLEGVSIALSPLPSIPVEVEYQRGGAGEHEEQSFLNLSLTGEDPANSSAMVAAQPLDGDRTREPRAGDPLVFRSVPPAHYALQAQIAAPWYVASASCGNLDLTRDPLPVGDGNGACSMRIVLRDDAATLQWSVANPGGMVAVMAFPLANLVQPVAGANSFIGSGSERITGALEGLAPGRYLVIAARHNLDLPYRDPEALKQYLSWGKEVSLAPNSQPEIELPLAPESAAGEP